MIPSVRFDARRWRAPLIRLVAVAALIAFCLWQIADHVAHLDGDAILAAIASVSVLQWSASVAVTAIAFLAVAGQERAAVAHLGLRIDPKAGRRAAMAAAAVSQTVGFGPVVGAVIRRRLLPELTVAQSAMVSLAITVGFFAGLGLVGLGFATFHTGGWAGLSALVAGGIVLCLALRRLPAPWRAPLPAPTVVLRFAGWLSLDLFALALACWIVMPSGALEGVGLPAFVPVFLVGLGAGLASGSPAGTGPFEATLLEGLPTEPNLTVAGIVAFRMVAYALPALCGAIWALCGPNCARGATQAGLSPFVAGAGWLRRLRRAELQLTHQGSLALVRTRDGAVWLAGRLPGVLAVVGDPLHPETRCTPAGALADARAEAAMTGTIPCLYRIGPRLAVAARRAGMRLLPVAQEAVIDPERFNLTGAARSGLRRKVRHAETAGVTVEEGVPLPLCEMADVAADWARRHGGERGFSMGRFDPETLTVQRVFLARGADGCLLAFLTFHQSQGEWVLDLIRSRDRIPDGTLYLLLCHALDAARKAGLRRLSLACVPVAGFGLRGVAGRIARRLTANAEGLRQFKAAFRPAWEPRYIAAPGWVALCVAGLAIAQAIHTPRPARR